VLLLFSTFGTDSSLAVRAYSNEHKIPQLFVQSSSAVFNDPAHFPWTMGFFPTYRTEGRAYANYLLRERQDARIALLYEGSVTGNEFVQGLKDALGPRAAKMIVAESSYHPGDVALDEQLTLFKRSGADVFMDFAIGAMATVAIRGAYDIDWHPLQFIPNASLSVAAFLEPAGLAKAAGIITSARSKGWLRPGADSDPDVRAFLDWMAKYNPHASLRDQNNVAGYERAEALVSVLKRCGDDLTRANVMAKAASMDMELPMLRPGVRVKTAPDDYQPVKQLYLIRFDGRDWAALNTVVSE
jgi:branched-chain amino acid transport system substrate-binding protein